MSQPRISVRLRPMSLISLPVKRFATALLAPKTATINKDASRLLSSQSFVNSGNRLRSNPTIVPTKALMSTKSENKPAFSFRPNDLVCPMLVCQV